MILDLEIRGQTWRDAFISKSLVSIYIIETCIWCQRLLNQFDGFREIYINVATSHFDLEFQGRGHNIDIIIFVWILWHRYSNKYNCGQRKKVSRIEILNWMFCDLFYSNFEGQEMKSHFLKFLDYDLVNADTKQKFLWYWSIYSILQHSQYVQCEWMNELILHCDTATEGCVSNDFFRHSLDDSPAS